MRRRFKLGQKVKLSRAWDEWNKDGQKKRFTTGVIVGLYDLSPETVKVLPTGLKRPQIWHANFWQPIK